MCKIILCKFKKNIFFHSILILELFTIFICSLGLFSKKEIFTYEPQKIEFDDIILNEGIYNIYLLYETEIDMNSQFLVISNKNCYDDEVVGKAYLYKDCNQIKFPIQIDENKSIISFKIECSDENIPVIHSLSIQETNILNRINLFWALFFSIAFNVIYFLLKYNLFSKNSVKNKNIIFGLGITFLFMSLPLMVDYIFYGDKISYYLLRVEGITQGLILGQFPVCVDLEWLKQQKYLFSIFNGDIFLYFESFLRLIGFSILDSYIIFHYILNFISILISYFCFKNIFKEEYIGVFCTFLYNLSLYIMFKLYLIGDMSEVVCLIILPLLVYGFFNLFSEDPISVSYKFCWIPLTIGYSLIILSDILMFELILFFTIILLLIFYKKTFCKSTMKLLLKTFLYTVFLSAWVWVPFIDSIFSYNLCFKEFFGNHIQMKGLYFAHLLLGFYNAGSSDSFEINGMAGMQPVGVGLSLLLGLFIFILLTFFGKFKGFSLKYFILGKIACFFAIISFILSLSIFPWDSIETVNKLFYFFVSTLVTPYRFLIFSTISLTIVAGVVALFFWKCFNKNKFAFYTVSMVVLVFCGSIYMINDFVLSCSPLVLNNSSNLNVHYSNNIIFDEPDEFGAVHNSNEDDFVVQLENSNEFRIIVKPNYEKNDLTNFTNPRFYKISKNISIFIVIIFILEIFKNIIKGKGLNE